MNVTIVWILFGLFGTAAIWTKGLIQRVLATISLGLLMWWIWSAIQVIRAIIGVLSARRGGMSV